MASPIQKALTAELARLKITGYRFVQGGKHPRLYVPTPAGERFMIFSHTANDGDGRIVRGKLGELRRLIGVSAPASPATKPAGRSRRKRHGRGLAMAALPSPDIEWTPSKDHPFANLVTIIDPVAAMFERIEQRVLLAEYRISGYPGGFKKWLEKRQRTGR